MNGHTVVAVDPGKTTGLAKAHFHDGDARAVYGFTCDELPTWDAVDIVNRWMDRVDLVVCESFTPRPGVRTWQPDALESIGAIRYLCRRAGVPFELQSPADGKRFGTDEKLRAMGWHRPSPGGHRNDAARHLLVAGVRHGWIDVGTFVG